MIRRTATWWVPVVAAAVVALVGWFALHPRFNDLTAPVPSRAAQSDLNAVVTLEQHQYVTTGSLDSEPALAELVHAQEPEVTVVPDRSTQRGTYALIAVTVSPDRRAALFAIRALDGRCWFALVNDRTAAQPPPFPDTRSTPGTTYGEVGIGHGPNRACSVTHGPAGTGGNAFIGWSAGVYPLNVP